MIQIKKMRLQAYLSRWLSGFDMQDRQHLYFSHQRQSEVDHHLLGHPQEELVVGWARLKLVAHDWAHKCAREQLQQLQTGWGAGNASVAASMVIYDQRALSGGSEVCWVMFEMSCS